MQGGHPELWEPLVNMTFQLTNTGDLRGHEVAQLYVGIPNAPARQLRGFERVLLQPGESRTVTFSLTRRDLSIWDVVRQQWHLQQGEYSLYVGASSRDLRLPGVISIRA